MKKILLLPVFAIMMLSCSSDESSSSTTGDEDTIENDADNDGIPDSEDTCLDCEAEGFDFSICDEDTYAQVTITNDDNTTVIETITYTNNLDYNTLTALSCDQLNDLYVSDSTPTDKCLACEASDISVNVCENENGESYTVTYDDKSVSFDYEDGETFENLNCVDLYAKGLELFAASN